MTKKIRFLIILVISVSVVLLSWLYLKDANIQVLNPKGQIASQEKNLMLFALGLSLIVVVPVFLLLAVFAVRYRESNTKAKYSPDFDHNRIIESLWWGIPSILILTLSVVTWRSSHTLDPYVPIKSTHKSLTIQVIAMDWKWLFIYPSENIASVNSFAAPVNTPINFEITSDAPMNSFWIPQLGGQIYAMPGMTTQLHLIGNQIGSYVGKSANISGPGFSGMTFNANIMNKTDYSNWVVEAEFSTNTLNMDQYNQLNQQSTNNPVTIYSRVSNTIFNNVVNKYNMPNMDQTTRPNTMNNNLNYMAM